MRIRGSLLSYNCHQTRSVDRAAVENWWIISCVFHLSCSSSCKTFRDNIWPPEKEISLDWSIWQPVHRVHCYLLFLKAYNSFLKRVAFFSVSMLSPFEKWQPKWASLIYNDLELSLKKFWDCTICIADACKNSEPDNCQFCSGLWLSFKTMFISWK